MKIKFPEKNKKYIYPLFLILLIVLSLYFFIFGSNGYLAHRVKINSITDMELKNQELLLQIKNLEARIKRFQTGDPVFLEEEARRLSLKKPDDIIIKLYHKHWIEQFAYSYELKQDQGYRMSESEFEWSVGRYKLIIGIFISLFIAFLLTFVLPKRFSNHQNQ